MCPPSIASSHTTIIIIIIPTFFFFPTISSCFHGSSSGKERFAAVFDLEIMVCGRTDEYPPSNTPCTPSLPLSLLTTHTHRSLQVEKYRELLLQVAPPLILVDMDGVLVDWDQGRVGRSIVGLSETLNYPERNLN